MTHCGDKGERSHGEGMSAGPRETTDRDAAVRWKPGGATGLQGPSNDAGPEGQGIAGAMRCPRWSRGVGGLRRRRCDQGRARGKATPDRAMGWRDEPKVKDRKSVVQAVQWLTKVEPRGGRTQVETREGGAMVESNRRSGGHRGPRWSYWVNHHGLSWQIL